MRAMEAGHQHADDPESSPQAPTRKPITLNELVQYFPKTTVYRDIRAKVKGYGGFNNRAAFENTLVCAKGTELYGTIIDDRLFTDLDDYSKWVKTEADKTDTRYALWQCIAAVARSREQVGTTGKPLWEQPRQHALDCQHRVREKVVSRAMRRQ